MSLVNYSDSEDDDNQADEEIFTGQIAEDGPTAHKRKRVEDDVDIIFSQPAARRAPPLPATFSTLYATNVRSSTSDDPALHGGRQRQLPHTPGIWPSFVYLEWLPCESDLNSLENLIAKMADWHSNEQSVESKHSKIHSSLRSELGVRLPLHVSLSAPLTLSTESKDDFERDLIRAVDDTDLASFSVTLSSVRWVSNFDGTRQFLILTLAKPAGNELELLLSTCNRVAKSFHLPQLYSKLDGKVGVAQEHRVVGPDAEVGQIVSPDDVFHLSTAWCLYRAQNSSESGSELPSEFKDIKIKFDALLLKIGNRISKIPFR